MLFIPYRAELDLHKIPFVTILICLLCLIVFLGQMSSNQKAIDRIDAFCDANIELSFQLSMDSIKESNDVYQCSDMFYSFIGKNDKDVDERLEEYIQNTNKLAGYSSEDSQSYIRDIMEAKLWSFRSLNLSDLTGDLLYYPRSYNVYKMFTSSVAHADWSHLLGNLYFFFVFAATVELMLGIGKYLLFLITLAIGTSVAYSLTTIGIADAYPTLGLSGVVMGMLGVFAYLMPTVGIRCFFWFFVFIRRFTLPAWIIALWFVGWDIYGVMSSEVSNVNFVAHLSGALIGVLFGIIFLRKMKFQFASDGKQ